MGAIGHYDDHPRYRYLGCLFGSDLLWGKSRENQPSLEVEAKRGTPWFPASSQGNVVSDDRGVNPAGPIYELLTCDVLGLGMADSELYMAGFEATRTYLGTQDLKLTVKLTDQMQFTEFLAKMAEYFDGWVRMRGTQLDLGYWAVAITTTQIAALPIIGSNDLLEEPDLPSSGYGDDTVTETFVKFSDRTHYFHDDNAKYPNPGLRRQLGIALPVYLDRSWITDAALAHKYAVHYGQKYGRPSIAGSIAVKVERIEAIEDAAGGAPIVGQLIKTDIASLGYEIVFRVTECEYPADNEGSCTLTLENERAIWPSIYIQPPPKKIGNFVVDVPDIITRRVVELPSGLKTKSAIQVAVLAQRPGDSIVGFHLHTSLDDVSYDTAPLPSTFAAWGRVVDYAYPNTTADIDDTVLMHVIFYGVDRPPAQNKHQRNNYHLLAFVDGEIMSIGGINALGAGKYACATRRACYGTIKATHAINGHVWMMFRENLNPIASKNFVIGNDVYFKLQPFDTHQEFNLADVTAFVQTIVGGAVGGISNLTLATDYKGTVKGIVDSFITANWDYIGDQDVAYFNVSHKRTADSTWTTFGNGKETTATIRFLEQGISYQVRVQAVNDQGERAAWSSIATITSADAPDLPLPTFIDDYTGDPIVDGASYDDVTPLSFRAQAPAGKQLRFQIAALARSTSPLWPWYPTNHGGTVGGVGVGTDMIGFIQSNGLGPTQHFTGGPASGPYRHTTVWHVAVIDPTHPTILGPQAVLTTTYIRVAVESWDQVPAPFVYYYSGTRGTNGYQIKADCTDSLATMYHSPSGLAGTWSVYLGTGAITMNAGDNHYFQAKRYIAPDYAKLRDSQITVFANTTSSVPNQGGSGGGGGGFRQEP